MKFDYTFDGAIMALHLMGSYPAAILMQREMKAYNEVKNGRIKIRKKLERKERTLGIHCK